MESIKKLVVHPNPYGPGIFILHPVLECGLSVTEIARKDVPDGVPFKIINQTDLPSDMNFFGAFEVDFSNPDGYGIGHEKWSQEQENQNV